MRLRLAALSVTGALVLAACAGSSPTKGARAPLWPGSAATHPGRGPSHLSVARDTRVLRLNLLVAERDDRLLSISPRGQVVWRLRQSDPTQVFVSATGRTLLISESRRSLVAMRRVDNHQVSFVYRGLDAPETALETAGGALVIADPARCTVDFVSPAARRALQTLGSPGACVHDPPRTFAAPDAAFPAAHGELVVTERDPAWLDVLSAHDRLLEAVHLAGWSAASDASAYASGDLIVTERSDPGEVEELGAGGRAIWRYGPSSGPGELDRPALARVLGGGDVLVVDSGNDRVIVIDPRSGAIVWQYGHTGIAGTRAGYLDDPQSATLVPLGGA
jgi:DNA-binding beta-propeller fold protein YncE